MSRRGVQPGVPTGGPNGGSHRKWKFASRWTIVIRSQGGAHDSTSQYRSCQHMGDCPGHRGGDDRRRHRSCQRRFGGFHRRAPKRRRLGHKLTSNELTSDPDHSDPDHSDSARSGASRPPAGSARPPIGDSKDPRRRRSAEHLAHCGGRGTDSDHCLTTPGRATARPGPQHRPRWRQPDRVAGVVDGGGGRITDAGQPPGGGNAGGLTIDGPAAQPGRP